METTKFFEELEKLRKPDPTSPTGWESDRIFCQRLGLANKSITLYKRGAIPTTETIRRVITKGGYTNEDMYRLLGAAAGGDTPRAASSSETPVFRASDVCIDGPISEKPLFGFSVPPVMNVAISRSTLSGILLSPDDTRCEPKVPRGAVVIYTTAPSEPTNQKLYVFDSPDGARVALIRVRGRQMWRSGETLDDLKQITLKEFENEVIGTVVMISTIEVNIPKLQD